NAAADWTYLRPRRLALHIARCIEQGTRWVVLEQSGRPLWRRVTAQVERFLAELAGEGAFPSAPAAAASFVVCDERVNAEMDTIQGRVRLLVGFAALRPGTYHSFLLTHSASGSSVRWVGVNQFQQSSESDSTAAARAAALAEVHSRHDP
ncbi:MAG TPA: hypothetical protein VLA56_08510, partial [Pseudomonadales bacterium]|nr:hypothetical protein [Pseudomonadales bacterium]